MATKTIGRIYLQRKEDIAHLLTIKTNTDKGDLYFSFPTSQEMENIGLRNIKLSYHKDGQTHINSEINHLKYIDDNIKRSNTKGLGFKNDNVYNISGKKTPLSEIKGLVHAGNGMSYKNVNDENHPELRIVDTNNVKQRFGMIDSKNYKNLSLVFYINAPKLSPNPEIMRNGINVFFVFPHPSLDLSILVQVVDFA